MSRNAGSSLIALCSRSDKCVRLRGPGQSNQDKKKGAGPYSIAAGMSIDFGANDFVNRCVLSPHVADGFVLLLVQLEIFLLLWRIKTWIVLFFFHSAYV